MNDPIAMLEWLVDAQQGIPTLAEMPRRTLSDKGIAGPTAAHVIEEIHTPLNLALVTFTTGSSAFQNIVGVTQNELLLRSAAGKRVLAECGVTAGQHMVVTYAPLVNVFTRQALDESGLHWSFLSRSCRDALLIALCRQQPDVVITGGEPCIHDLLPLTDLLEKNGFSCQIETSGTHEVRCTPNTWVTVSPKLNMRGGYEVLSQALERANEIKHPVGRVRDIEALDELLATLTDDKPRVIALQPISQKDDATRLCIETCIARNWRLSMQTHKYLNIA